MPVPKQFKDYDSREYFGSEKFTCGFYDEHALCWTFYAAADVTEHSELAFLAVGGPGVDGIEWGYRKGHAGLWAFYPVERRFEFLAPTLVELFDGWYSGCITV